MSDVLERLEAWAAYAEGGALPTCSPVTGREAISEIERLRDFIRRDWPYAAGPIEVVAERDAEIERLRDELSTFRLGKHHVENAELKAEIERLRQMLRDAGVLEWVINPQE